MYRTLINVLAAVSACVTFSVHAQMSQSDGKIAVSSAEAPWEVVFPKGTWLIHVQRQTSPGAAYYFFSSRENLFSVFEIEPSPPCQSAAACRADFRKKPTLNVKKDVKSFSYMSVNDFDVARFFVSEINGVSEIGGVSVRQLFLSAHHVEANHAVHVAVWGIAPDPNNEKAMLEFIHGLSLRKK